MFLCAAIAIILLLLTILLHYNQHFTVECCPYRSNTKIPMKIRARSTTPVSRDSTRSSFVSYTESAVQRKRIPCCIFRPINKELQFYPSSFALYIIFVMILTLSVIAIQVLNHNDNHTETHWLQWLLYELQPQHHHSVSRSTTYSKHNVIMFVLNIVLIFGIMMLAIWESLFTFYRYYTTLKSTVDLQLVSTKTVLKKFIIYPVIFCILFVFQIYVYYWLWPLLLLLHCVFNGYFSYTFSSILIHNYNMFDELSHSMHMGSATADANQQILESVYIIRKTSFICTLIQCVYLSLFVIISNMNIIYYLPILWAISCVVLTLNFARNRTAIRHCCIRLSNICACVHMRRSNTVHVQSQIEEKHITLHIDIKQQKDKICTDNGTIRNQFPINTNPLYGLKQHTYNGNMDEAGQTSKRLNFSEITNTNEVKTEVIEPQIRGKALKLLGLETQATIEIQKSSSLKKTSSKSIKCREMISKPTSSLSLSLKRLNNHSKHENMTRLISDIDDDKDKERESIENKEKILNNINDHRMNRSYSTDVIDYGSDIEAPEPAPFNPQKLPKLKLKSIENKASEAGAHAASLGNEEEYAKAFRNLTVLAAIGFCCVKDLNSFDQIKKYNQHIVQSSVDRINNRISYIIPKTHALNQVSDDDMEDSCSRSVLHLNLKNTASTPTRTTTPHNFLSTEFIPKEWQKTMSKSDTELDETDANTTDNLSHLDAPSPSKMTRFFSY